MAEAQQSEQATALIGLPAALAATANAAEPPPSSASDEECIETDLLRGGSPSHSREDLAQGKGGTKTAVPSAADNSQLKSSAANAATNSSNHAQAAFSLASTSNTLTPTAPDSATDNAAQAKQGMPSHTNQFGLPTALRHTSSSQALPQLPIASPSGRQAWSEEVGNQVRWMLGRAESRAELVLTPPSLGKLEVSISLSGDQATAQFVASTQAARDALEQAMPKLREILEQAGLALGQADVSTSEDRGAAGGEQGSGRALLGHENGTSDDTGAITVVHDGRLRHDGLIDTFA